jgi:hypothetical protein
MALFNHVPEDRRATLYGRPCQEKDMDPRGRITHGAHWYGDKTDVQTPRQKTTVQKNYRTKRVFNVETGQVFDSITAAADFEGITQNAMTSRLRSKNGGYKYVDGQEEKTTLSVIDAMTGKVYDSAMIAGEDVGMDQESIRANCQGKYKTQRFYYVRDYKGEKYTGPVAVKNREVVDRVKRKIYPSAAKASDATGVPRSTIYLQCKSKTGNSRFAYAD